MKRLNEEGEAIIKEFEELRLVAYLDGGGVPTIGWGHTKGVELGMVIDEEEAEDFFIVDIAKAEKAVNTMVYVPLVDSQFSALVSLVFNIGVTAFKNSTLLRLLNEGDYDEAAEQFDRWVYDNGNKVSGLKRRRKKEKELFNEDR